VTRFVTPEGVHRRHGSRKGALLVSSVAILGLTVACVDLFHPTDFETLCAHDAQACGSEAGAGDASVDAPGEHPLVEFCAWKPAEALERAQNACGWLGACAGAFQERSFGACMVRALAAYDCSFNPGLRPAGEAAKLWSCLSDVTSCATVDACIAPDGLPPCPPLTAGQSFTACTAGGAAKSVRVECSRTEGGRPTKIEPCALFGKACGKINDSASECMGPTTTGPLEPGGGPPPGCNVGRRCEGSAAVDCAIDQSLARDRGTECASFGAGACSVSGDAGPACAPIDDAGACDGGSALACSGASVTSCVGGKQVVVNCAKQGLACQVAPAPAPDDPLAACKVAGSGCTGQSDQCVGDTLKSCGQGQVFEVSCKVLGLGGCQLVGGGSVATCTPPSP
jgi:hypothetical protein